MEPIVGIVSRKNVPPTLEPHKEGMVLRFYKCGPILLRCTIALILDLINEGREIEPYPYFEIKSGSKRVTITLKYPEKGNGIIILKKNEFLALLASA